MPFDRNNSAKRRRRRIIAIGDLNCKVKLQTRVLNTQFQTGNKDEARFTTVAEIWALVETSRGGMHFDGVEIKRGWTHDIYIRYRKNIDQTYWIEWRGKRYDILDVENYDERNEFMRLRCLQTGTNSPTNKAAEG